MWNESKFVCSGEGAGVGVGTGWWEMGVGMKEVSLMEAPGDFAAIFFHKG